MRAARSGREQAGDCTGKLREKEPGPWEAQNASHGPGFRFFWIWAVPFPAGGRRHSRFSIIVCGTLSSYTISPYAV